MNVLIWSFHTRRRFMETEIGKLKAFRDVYNSPGGKLWFEAVVSLESSFAWVGANCPGSKKGDLHGVSTFKSRVGNVVHRQLQVRLRVFRSCTIVE